MTLLFAPFAYFLPGYFFLKYFWNKEEKMEFFEAVVLSIALSFFLSYPLGLANNVTEFLLKDNPFSIHIDTIYPIYLFFVISFYFLTRKNPLFYLGPKVPGKKFFLILILIFCLAVFMRLYGSHLQNINGDEQELSLSAYHLVDGIYVGRDAFFLSSTVHSPLGFFIANIIYQVISPFSYDAMNEIVLRAPMFVFSILELCLFLLFATKIQLSRSFTLLGLLFLAINTYAIFAGRLFIPQDGSIFTFYLLLFSYFFIHLANAKKTPTNKEIILLSLLLSACIFIKLSAILLFPVIIIYYFWQKKDIKDLFKIFLLAAILFSPVIIFNVSAYILTGYMDVPFSKLANLIGIEAKSLMHNQGLYSSSLPPFRQTLLGFLQMLGDQWSLPLATAFIISFFSLFKIKMRSNPYSTYLILLTIIFFSFNGYRAYYAEFLTVPFILIFMHFLQSVWYKYKIIGKNIILVFVISIFSYSTVYSINTHIFILDKNLNIETSEFGRDKQYTLDEFFHHFSLASWSFLRDDGFKNLSEYLDRNPSQFIVIEDDFLNQYLHHFRWYLGIHNDVESFYLGDNYTDDYDYSVLSDFNYDKDALLIYSYEEGLVEENDIVVSNTNSNPKIVLRNFSVENQ